jgi:hypothetical protein
MLSLPCPKCRKPNPVESRTCNCGHTLVQQNAAAAPVAAPFPELRSILPELKRKPANLRLVVTKENKADSPAPDRPKLVEVSSSTIASPTFALPESTSGSNRLIYGMVFAGLILMTTTAAYLSGFIEVPSMLEKPAEPVQLAQSDPSPAKESKNDSVSNDVAVVTANEQIVDTPDKTAAAGETALKAHSAKPIERRLPGNQSKTADSEPKIEQPGVANPAQGQTFDVLSNSDEKSVANTAVAVAKCGDGTYTYRKSASGTCAQRGGVAQWLDGTKPSPSSAKPTKPEADRIYILGSRGGCYYTTASGVKKYVDKSNCN